MVDLIVHRGLKFGCHSFGPEPIWSLDFWSPTFCPHGQMIPQNSVPMDKWSPTNLVPLDKRSPSNLVPLDKWSPKIWSPWTNGPQPIWSPYSQIITACPPGQTEYFRDHLSRGTKLVGDHLSMGTELVGDHLSRGTNCRGPNVRGPYAFGTKCVTAGRLQKRFGPILRALHTCHPFN